MMPPTIVNTPTPPVATSAMPAGTATGTAQPNMQTELQRIQQEALGIQAAINQLPQEPTIQQSFAAPTPDQHGDPAVEAYLRSVATTEVNEDEINRRQMALFQKEIDATNQIYGNLMQEAQFQGQGRIGSQRAISARSGLLGSDFGASQKETVMDYNRQIERGIAAEQAARIAAIQGFARKSAADEIAAKNAARMQGADAYIKYLGSAAEVKSSNLQKLAAAMLEQGESPFTMDEQALKEIAGIYGTTVGDIQSTFQTFKSQSDAEAEANLLKRTKTEAEINKLNMEIEKGQWQSIGEGTMLINPTTGERIKNPKTSAPSAASGLKVGGQTLNQSQVADVHNTLQETRGSDGYANTGTYMRELEGFVALGGDPKDFIKEYNPDIYINPNDPTRSFLQSQMKKPASDNLFLGALGGIDIGSAIAEASSGN